MGGVSFLALLKEQLSDDAGFAACMAKQTKKHNDYAKEARNVIGTYHPGDACPNRLSSSQPG
jgi:hypothetical protein